MCVGIPMRVVEPEGAFAWCEGRGERRRLSMLLVGEQPAGTWVLAFIDAAREIIDPSEAARIDDALDALEAALRGETDLGRFFSDLAQREPELPAHLKGAAS
ncbi:MAG: HypC/HybG/HupF family hydrogenase formation chaperone [Betaproteobacteria bacterium]|nr:HypC/HybG/HupF family hydrogenase formation chaperone [Betaproteobacteria bacterium]